MDVKPVGFALGGEFHYISPGHGLADGALLYSQRELEFVYARAERAEAEVARLRKHVPVALRGEG